MPGMSRHNGAPIGPMAHLRQSIEDILTTPLGTRVCRRDYGSRLPDLTDLPMTPALKVEIASASADALDRWEPRFTLSRVHIARVDAAGAMALGIEGEYLGQPVTVEGILI